MEEYIEFKLTREDTEISMKLSANIDMVDLFEKMRQFASAIGYHPDTVKEYFDE